MEDIYSEDYNNLVCDVCGGCKCHTCTCPGGPRGPKFHPGFHDLPHGDDIEGD